MCQATVLWISPAEHLSVLCTTASEFWSHVSDLELNTSPFSTQLEHTCHWKKTVQCGGYVHDRCGSSGGVILLGYGIYPVAN